MQVPASESDNVVPMFARPMPPDHFLLMAASLMHAQGRLFAPGSTLDQNLPDNSRKELAANVPEGWSKNIEDIRDPDKGFMGKTPDVSSHGGSATPGSAVKGGLFRYRQRDEGMTGDAPETALTPDPRPRRPGVERLRPMKKIEPKQRQEPTGVS